MDAGGSCSHKRNKIRYFGGLKMSATGASVLVVDWKIWFFGLYSFLNFNRRAYARFFYFLT